MAAVHLEALEQGRYRVIGELSFATVGPLLEQSRKQLEAAPPTVEIDLSGVQHSDSAGLALLIEWLRLAMHAGKQLRYSNLPEQLLAIARMSDIDDLLAAQSDALDRDGARLGAGTAANA